jgi:hypothetical protein
VKRYVDISGQIFGKLTVICRAGSNRDRKATWLCKCECGKEAVVAGRSLRCGETKSCGCLRYETRPRLHHGHNRKGLVTSTYVIWIGMIKRCGNSKSDQFHNYGGRGISVCERWKVFNNFLDDMGERPSGMSLDRFPDRDGDYEPGNCRWSTPAQQAQNTNRTMVNEVSVALIRHMRCRGSLQADLAHAFGVSRSNISAVIRRETWR